MVSELVVFTSRSGSPSLKVNGTPYYSEYDPLREVRRFCSALPIEDADVILLFGWGLGYCGNVVQPRLKPGARVIVFEPDAELFRLSETTGESHKALHDPRFRFVVGEAICHFFDIWALEGCGDTDRFLWIEWPACASLAVEVLKYLNTGF